MKKILLLFTMSVFLIGSLSIVLSATPPPNNDCNADCTAIDNLGMNHGQCVSFCTTCTNNGATEDVCFCNLQESLGILEASNLSFGDCLQSVDQLMNVEVPF